MLLSDIKLAIIGLGYVGLPLAVAFGEKREVVGFDINADRIMELKDARDHTLEVSPEEIKQSNGLTFSADPRDLSAANCYIVTVPTPVNELKQPNLSPLIAASNLIGCLLSKGDIVIYESTVYPGATEDDCVPELERASSLKFNEDFFVGYSPERINPGDKSHRLKDIVKVTAGSTHETASLIDDLYGLIIEAGTYKASSIKVAEAAKVIENTQRDVNIGLINELSLIFDKMDIDTEEVLLAAGTKWNFLNFRPGLVGGHCIGVDPYYLTHKAQLLGYDPEIILAGRRLNDGMAKFVASKLIRTMKAKLIAVENSRVLIMGLTFKENCPDLRNTKVLDIAVELQKHDIYIDAFDPWLDIDASNLHLPISLISNPEQDSYDAIIVAVAHSEFKEMGSVQIRSFGKVNHILFDLKYLFSSSESDLRL
jgi:UDP-N-acetyl-D-galactosamine dehydrogenase